ncbi:alpha/beta hydrolase [Spirosoma endophyticum]|uniref:Acetyl esterase n=1 Tax=Spirosoma endophyticum TaxID=662367 RepID=A0A1I1GXW8_9BACT|nr:alpha/beta hydrolase [Spirosoma endophyticum]SFC13820.1 acetyl esterase [Spirosoma endophyticum]
MQLTIRQALFITFLFSSLITFAQNGPPTVEQVRSSINRGGEQAKMPLESVFKTEVRKIWSGSDSISIQIYYPNNKRNLPILYNVHGGAFIMSALESNIARVMCNRTGSVVVSVDYRVAPEHPFPASINDCYAVWNWIDQNAERIQGDNKKISLIGDSAGGLFIGSLQVMRQVEGHPGRPLALVFVNPGIDMRPTAAGADYYALVTNWYLHGADPVNPLVSPILGENFKDYPPSLIIVCEKDEIKQHGLVLAEKLKAASVSTQVVDLPGLGHLAGYWGAANPLAKPAVDAAVTYINSANAKMDK